jgi:hypothetical protein
MTNQHRARPDDWAQQEDWANRSVFSDSSCIIELRDRIEALEIARLITHGITAEEVAPGSVLERMAILIANFASTGLPGDDATPTARAAILEVATWLRNQDDGLLAFGLDWATRLQREANRG